MESPSESPRCIERQPLNIPQRLLHPIPEARQMLGGIGHTKFYALVKAGRIKLTKIGGRSFVTPSELQRCVEEAQR